MVIDDHGYRVIRFDHLPDPDRDGALALPPYMKREEEAEDRERYQTVFAQKEGAIAAPTAGLHFTEELLDQVSHAFVTLHVGLGTFLPMKSEDPEEHDMHEESFEIEEEAIHAMTGRRVLAVGTTVVRVLESWARRGMGEAMKGETDLFIRPPYQFHVVERLLTNFHLPHSTLLLLVSAFAGEELVREAYARAMEEKYRFYSYGDCMLIL
ncbi:MAG: S-adenosylmethionine:tRNA ribosyltransferase-isomerase [Verrucomicrobiota bacterium]